MSFVIVNSHDLAGQAEVFEKSDLIVLQDIQKMAVWSKYEAEVDDMIIFDKYVNLKVKTKQKKRELNLRIGEGEVR